jgi:hypothetical protein
MTLVIRDQLGDLEGIGGVSETSGVSKTGSVIEDKRSDSSFSTVTF